MDSAAWRTNLLEYFEEDEYQLWEIRLVNDYLEFDDSKLDSLWDVELKHTDEATEFAIASEALVELLEDGLVRIIRRSTWDADPATLDIETAKSWVRDFANWKSRESDSGDPLVLAQITAKGLLEFMGPDKG